MKQITMSNLIARIALSAMLREQARREAEKREAERRVVLARLNA